MARPAVEGLPVGATAAGGAGSFDPVPRRLRADAARNRQRLIEAAAEVFAARGLDATLDEVARHAGVNVATAYRHFANKHELAREFLRQCVDQAAAISQDAAASPDPWAGLTQLLERLLEQIMSNRALIDVLTRAYGSDHFDQFLDRTSAPLGELLARGQQAGVVRADVTVTDFPAILEMLSAVTGLGIPGVPDLPHRYIGLILAGLRPGAQPLPGSPPTREALHQAAATVAAGQAGRRSPRALSPG
jgi:AcrR family transcriptional regulator